MCDRIEAQQEITQGARSFCSSRVGQQRSGADLSPGVRAPESTINGCYTTFASFRNGSEHRSRYEEAELWNIHFPSTLINLSGHLIAAFKYSQTLSDVKTVLPAGAFGCQSYELFSRCLTMQRVSQSNDLVSVIERACVAAPNSKIHQEKIDFNSTLQAAYSLEANEILVVSLPLCRMATRPKHQVRDTK